MMGFFQTIRSWFSGPTERRSIAGSESWITSPSLAGVIVTEETAPTFAAVYSCIVVLASDLSSIPFLVMKRAATGGKTIDFANPIQNLVFHSPDEEMSAMSWLGSKMWHLQTHGNAYSKINRDSYLRPESLTLLDPRKVQPRRSKGGKLWYDTSEEAILSEDMVHVANVGWDGIVGKSPIRQCMESIGLGMATEKFGAAYFGNGINKKGILTTAQELDQVERDQLRKEIMDQHGGPYNAARFLLLQGGLSFQDTAIPADEAQFIATRKFQLEECCRIFRVPPTKVQNLDRANFANLEEVNLDYYDSSLKPWARRFEIELTRKLFTKAERQTYTVEHDVSSLLKGRILDQANADKLYRDMGVNNADEIRAMRNRGAPIEGGKVYLVPLNMAPLDKVAGASIETLKGVKPQAKESIDDEVNAPVVLADTASLDALRAVVLDVAQRMTRREANAVRKIAKKSGLPAVLEGLDEFYRDESMTLAAAFAPSLRAYAALTRRSDLDATTFASQLVADSRRDLLVCVEGPQTIQSINNLADRWEAGKPAQICALLPSGAAS